MNSTPDFTWLFMKMVAGLAVVLALAFVLIRYVLPKTQFGRGRHRRDWVQVIDRFLLESNRSLYLVKMAGRYFVLGASEHSVNLVAELSSSEGEKIENS